MKGISETAFASQVEDLFTMYGWHWFHLRPARTGKTYIDKNGREKEIWNSPVAGNGVGFLDYTALRPPRIIVAELKDENGEETPEQKEWHSLWEQCQKVILLEPIFPAEAVEVELPSRLVDAPTLILPEVYLWRPHDIDDIAKILGR